MVVRGTIALAACGSDEKATNHREHAAGLLLRFVVPPQNNPAASCGGPAPASSYIEFSPIRAPAAGPLIHHPAAVEESKGELPQSDASTPFKHAVRRRPSSALLPFAIDRVEEGRGEALAAISGASSGRDCCKRRLAVSVGVSCDVIATVVGHSTLKAGRAFGGRSPARSFRASP